MNLHEVLIKPLRSVFINQQQGNTNARQGINQSLKQSRVLDAWWENVGWLRRESLLGLSVITQSLFT